VRENPVREKPVIKKERTSNKEQVIKKEIYSEIEKSKIIEENERTLTQSFLFYFTLL
jgi:hypothetical protein